MFKASDNQRNVVDMLCLICKRNFSCKVHGFNDLVQHANGVTHIQYANNEYYSSLVSDSQSLYILSYGAKFDQRYLVNSASNKLGPQSNVRLG